MAVTNLVGTHAILHLDGATVRSARSRRDGGPNGGMGWSTHPWLPGSTRSVSCQFPIAPPPRRWLHCRHAGTSDPDARFDAYGAAYVRLAFEHPVHHRVMFTTALEPPARTERDGEFRLDADPRSPRAAELVRSGEDVETLAREVIAHWRATR